MKLKIWKKGCIAEEDTVYFRLEYAHSQTEEGLYVNIVQPNGDHEWYVLSINKEGLERIGGLPDRADTDRSPDLIPLPFPVEEHGECGRTISLRNEPPVIRD